MQSNSKIVMIILYGIEKRPESKRKTGKKGTSAVQLAMNRPRLWGVTGRANSPSRQEPLTTRRSDNHEPMAAANVEAAIPLVVFQRWEQQHSLQEQLHASTVDGIW
jgi:hypothetical protein